MGNRIQDLLNGLPNPQSRIEEQLDLLGRFAKFAWANILNKPFETIGDGLVVDDGALKSSGYTKEQINEMIGRTVQKPASDIPANYAPTSDGEGGYSWQEQSGGILPTVVVSAVSGSTVTLSKGLKVLTAEAVSGTWSFRPTEFGIWTATAVKDGVTATNTVDVQAIKTYRIPVYTGAVYGIKRTVANSSPEWERTDDAVNFTFSPTLVRRKVIVILMRSLRGKTWCEKI